MMIQFLPSNLVHLPTGEIHTKKNLDVYLVSKWKITVEESTYNKILHIFDAHVDMQKESAENCRVLIFSVEPNWHQGNTVVLLGNEKSESLETQFAMKSSSSESVKVESTSPFRSRTKIVLNKKPNPHEIEPLSVAAEKMLEGPVPEIEKMMALYVRNAMNTYFNTHKNGKGIWYASDYIAKFGGEQQAKHKMHFDGAADEKFFNVAKYTFTLKSGKKASEALLKFLEGPTVADCGNAVLACYYKCALDLLKNKFDKYFSNEKFAMTICSGGVLDLISPLTRFIYPLQCPGAEEAGTLGNRPLKEGATCYFGGVKLYRYKHPLKHWIGWHVIYIGKIDSIQKFVAHGYKEPLSEREIYKKLIEAYNEDPTQDEIEHMDRVSKENFSTRSRKLREHKAYTISEGILDKNISAYLDGYQENSPCFLNAKIFLLAMLTNNIEEFIAQLDICWKQANN